MKLLTHQDVRAAAVALSCRLPSNMRIYGVPRGGVSVVYLLLAVSPGRFKVVDSPEEADVIIDDVYDSGNTRNRYADKTFGVLYFKDRQLPYAGVVYYGHVTGPNDFLSFPWEGGTTEGSAEDIGTRLLQLIGEDVHRQGLRDTPARFIRAWREWTSGYAMDPKEVFKAEAQFEDGAELYDEMVLVDPIPFYSHCEHHLAAMFGTVHIAYIPDGKIAGLSKFVRLVNVLSKRLQVQERLTTQIIQTIQDVLQPVGVSVLIRGRHFCMESRGVKSFGTETTTIAHRGAPKDEVSARAEFLSIIKGR